MNTRKVIYLINLLRESTTGLENQLNALYKNAINDNDDVKKLIDLLNTCNFYKGRGSSLRESGETLLNKLYEKPSDALQTLQDISQKNEMIEHEIRLCLDRIYSPDTFNESITIMRKKDIIPVLAAYKQIASSCVYLMVLYKGIEAIRGLSWNDTNGILEVIHLVNTKFLPMLIETEVPEYSWVIRKKKVTGKALFSGEQFYLSYEESKHVKSMCSIFPQEPMGTHAYLNTRAYESNELDVPYCWGSGNIVSFSPSEALFLLQTEVITKLRSPSIYEFTKTMPTPIECINGIAGEMAYCITPDELVNMMNQWCIGKEIENRKRDKRCLFCGKHVIGTKLVCASHFSTEL